jgi:hypothetical protein
MKQQWKIKWNSCEEGRLAHSIFPNITDKPWFHELPEERKIITTISRIITGHCSVKSHLNRFNIVEDPLCVCQENYETVDHLLWECSRYDRSSLVPELLAQNIEIGTGHTHKGYLRPKKMGGNENLLQLFRKLRLKNLEP